MQATERMQLESKKTIDEYLGYTIQEIAGWYLAVPNGWNGEVIEAPSMPQMRRKIWRWWYQMAV